ncbi:unnamed protein product [Clavelina lepadiformis]|uniref:WSC domain-containing protein n=1 Tax=Clavelina lepadiformis TaxID=159417 RepID=A0ABP0F983_CLALP
MRLFPKGLLLISVLFLLSILAVFKKRTTSNSKVVTKAQSPDALQSEGTESFEIQIRCKVHRVGCLLPIDGFSLLKDQSKEPFTGVPDCIHHCSKNNFTYAATNEDKECLCGTSVSYKYIENDGNLLSASASKCKELKGAYVNRIVKKCNTEKLSSILEQHDMVGCFPTPSTWGDDSLTLGEDLSLPKCLLTCESKSFAYAILVGMKSCVCWNPILRLHNFGYPHQTSDLLPCHKTSNNFSALFRTYVQNVNCKSKRFLPTNFTPRVALLSFPGSGNTWLRHLLEMASGFYTGSIYQDEALYGEGYLGEYLPWDSGRTIAIKTHKPEYSDDRPFDKIIFLIRNPFDAIVAEFNRLHGGHTGLADQKDFEGKEWEKFVPYKVEKWSRTIYSYLNAPPSVYVVYYEDLLVDPIKQVKLMIKFIGIGITDFNQRLLCTEENLNGNWQRPPKDSVKDYYLPWMVELMNKYIRNARNLLKLKNFKDLPKYER